MFFVLLSSFGVLIPRIYLALLSKGYYFLFGKRYPKRKYRKIMLSKAGCPKTMLSISDALEAVEGKWKLLILFVLAEKPKRFKQIAKEVSGITDKTLSKELKNLEANKLVRRDVYDTFPPTVEYSITPHGLSLEKVLDELHFWGLAHRKKVIGK